MLEPRSHSTLMTRPPYRLLVLPSYRCNTTTKVESALQRGRCYTIRTLPKHSATVLWSTLWLAASTQRSIVLVNRFDLVHSIRFATYRKRLCALRSFVQVVIRKQSKRSSAQFSTTLVSCQATRCERLALCRQLILSAKWAAATPVAALPLAGHQQALTGNNNDLTFATRL